MGGAFLGAVEHRGLRKFTFSLSKLTIIHRSWTHICHKLVDLLLGKDRPSSMLGFLPAPPPPSMLVFSRDVGASCVKINIEKGGAARGRKFCAHFPNSKIDPTYDFYCQKSKKSMHLWPKPLLKWNVLIHDVFCRSSRAQKSGSHSRHSMAWSSHT